MAKKTRESEDKLKEEMVKLIDGKLYTQYLGNPIVLHSMSVADENYLAQVYHREVARLTTEGVLPNEAMVQALVAKKATQLGLDPQFLDPKVQVEWYRKVYLAMPAKFLEGAKDPEKIIEQASEFADQLSESDARILEGVTAVMNLKNEMMAGTVEVAARRERTFHELWRVTKNLDGTRFWPSVIDVLNESTENLGSLLQEYQDWKQGMSVDFLSKLPRAHRGNVSGDTLVETDVESSQSKKSRSGRSTKRS